MTQCNCKNTDELHIVRGNAFAIRLTVSAIHIDGTPVENFVLGEAEAVLKVMHLDEKTQKDFLVIGNDAVISFGGELSLGWYGFEMTGTFNGKPWRWCVPQVFQVVETNAKANIPAWAVLTDETYSINGVMTITSGDIYQSDWNETNPQSPSYIKNKPDVVLHPEFNQTVQRIDRDIDAEKLSRQQADKTLQENIGAEEIRAKAAEKQNADDIDTIEGKIPAAASSENKLVDKQQMDNATADFITKSVNDLVNYYLKSDTYTKSEVQQLIAAVKQFTYEVVQTLPTASASTMNKIYLVPSTNPETKNIKDEYITIATETEDVGETVTTYSWEQIGSTTVDLSGYYTSAQTDTAISNALTTALADYSTTSEMNTAITNALNTALADYSTTTEMTAAIAAAIANYYTKSEVDALIANFITKSVNDLVNYYLKSDTYTKSEVQQLIAAVKQFTYEVVQTLPTASASTMNKIYLVPSTNPETKNVKDEYITIATETEEGGETVTTYSWEQIGSTTVDLSGYYTSAQTDTAISNALTTALADYSTTSEMNTAITNALNTALADYSTTTEMTAAIAAAIANYYTKSEVDALIANFITKSVNDLVNYYLKSDTYTKSEVQQLIAAVKQFTYEVVQTLPTASASTMNKIYLVPSTNPETKNVKDEYITIATETEEGGETVTTYSWEQIGSTTVDLSGYYTSAQTDTAISNALTTALADYSTTSQMNTAITNALNTALADYSTTTEMTAAIAAAIANYYTKTEVDNKIGNLGSTDPVYYTQAEADAYNAQLTGALDDQTPLTAEQAALYNAAITGGSKEAGDTLTAAEANAYNATLEGAVSTSDVKIPAEPKSVKQYVDDKFLSKCINITYAELKALRDNSQLVAGQWYRITDYVTTTAQADTQSAAHPFDVIVMALEKGRLSEVAYAAQHEGDTYFNGAQLESWELRYCLDNDTTRFAWADATTTTTTDPETEEQVTTPNGKGVIYWMRDQNGNECPYDFKNIMFLRRPLTGRSGLVMDASLREQATYDAEAVQAMATLAAQLGTSMSASNYGYWHSLGVAAAVLGSTLTSSYVDYQGNAATIDAEAYYMPMYYVNSKYIYCKCSDAVYLFTFHFRTNNVDRSLTDKKVNDNVIRPYFNSGKRTLNNNVFMFYNTSSYDSYGNTLGFNCYNNTFSQQTYLNTFGNNVQYNTFGNNVYYNTFGNNVRNNTFGNNVYGNTFGNYVYYNTFGNDVRYNTFGNYVWYNTFGNGVQYNTFGNSVYRNTFGNSVYNNTFGNNVRYNTFGNYVYQNTFGNGVQYVVYGQSVMSLGSYFYYNIIENGNQYLLIDCTETTSSSAKCQNIKVSQGVNNTSTQKTLTVDVVEQQYQITFQAAASEIRNV